MYRRIRSRIQSPFWEAPGNCRETEIKTQQRVLKRGVKKASGNSSRVMCVSSGSRWKQRDCVENQLERTRLDFHNMQISDCRYVEKVLEKLRQKLRLSSCTLDAKTNVLISGLFMSTTMKSSVHLWTPLPRERGCLQEHQVRGAQDVVRHCAKIDRETIIRDSECIYDDMEFHILDENYFAMIN